MNKFELEMHLYMGSHSKIVDWLKSEGVTTKKEAKLRLKSAIEGNIKDVIKNEHTASHGTLAGTVMAIREISKYFK